MSAISDYQAILPFLRQNQFPIEQGSVNKLELSTPRLKFVVYLLETFGASYKSRLQEKLDADLANEFDQVRRSCGELKQKVYEKDSHEFPATQSVIQKDKENQEWWLGRLQACSYRALPFLQESFVHAQGHEVSWALIEKVEKARKRAFRQITAELSSEPAEWSAEEEMAITNLAFNGGAYPSKQKPVPYIRTILDWGCLSEKNKQAVQAFLGKLTLRHWILGSEVNLPPALGGDQGKPWKEFLAERRLEQVQQLLNFPFTESLKKEWGVIFESDETVAGDVCYFLDDIPRFYQMDLTGWNRPSKPILLSLQLFLFITREYGATQEKQASLLQMLRNRDPKWEGFAEFAERTWGPPKEEDRSFSDTWFGFQWWLQGISKNQQFLLGNPPLENCYLLKEPTCWPLFRFLWQCPEREHFFVMLGPLLQHPCIAIDVPKLLKFCKNNEEHLDAEQFQSFKDNYLGILEEEKLAIPNMQVLFLDAEPPFVLKPPSDGHLILSGAPEHCRVFVEKMGPYPVDSGTYRDLLREFILHPSPWVFDFLEEDTKLLKIAVGKELLLEIFSVHRDPVPIAAVTPEIRQRARQMAVGLRGQLHFSDAETFSLYLKFLKLLIANQEAVIRKTAEIVFKLKEFHSEIKNRDLCFLFLHPPKVSVEQIERFFAVRETWAENEEELDRVVIHQGVFKKIEREVDSFLALLSSGCEDEDSRSEFLATRKFDWLHIFFPPLQPLTDYFRIKNITEKEGIIWELPDYATHLGQMKSMSQGTLSVYFHWFICMDRPTLFFSFYGPQEASSAFISLNVSAQSLLSQQKRAEFWRLLNQVCHQVISEDTAIAEVDDHQPEILQAINQFEEAFDKGDLVHADLTAIIDFLKRLKVAYRRAFLGCLPPSSSQEPSRVAASGRIFPSGALIPDFLLPFALDPKAYTPDADASFISECFQANLFKMPEEKGARAFVPLTLDLTVEEEGQIASWPISYRVQTAEDVTGLDQEAAPRLDEKALKWDQVKSSFVTLSIDEGRIQVPLFYSEKVLKDPVLFQRYFVFHNLILKSMYYYNGLDN